MAITWTVGQLITATRLNNRLPITAVTAADVAVISDSTVNNDAYLVFALKAGITYDLKGALQVIAASGTPDFKYGWAWTNTAAVTLSSIGPVGTIASGSSGDAEFLSRAPDATSPSQETGYGATTTVMSIAINDRIVVASAADITLTFQWAQTTSSADSLTLKAGSFITAFPVA
jgi:hypothetical protein